MITQKQIQVGNTHRLRWTTVVEDVHGVLVCEIPAGSPVVVQSVLLRGLQYIVRSDDYDITLVEHGFELLGEGTGTDENQ